MTKDEFNAYRRRYNQIGYWEKTAIHKLLWEQHRVQKHFDPVAFAEFFDTLPEGSRVVELGGWDGELGRKYADRVASWRNYEICWEAVEFGNKLRVPHYVALHSDRVVEFQDANVFVASHVLEHMSEKEVLDTLDHMVRSKVNHLYYDLPMHQVNDSTSLHVSEPSGLIESYLNRHEWINVGEHNNARWWRRREG